MKRVITILKQGYEKQIDGIGLAVFRIFYCVVLLLEIGQLFYFRHLVYDKIPYLEESEIEFTFPLLVWALSVCFILVGYKTRTATLINYILSLVCIGTIHSYEYHMFYTYMGINFLLIFIPISKCFSLDSLINRLRFSYFDIPLSSDKVSSLNYKILILVGIALVYIDSIFYKVASDIWMNGLGLWLPANLPMVTHFDSSWLMNKKGVIIFLGYFTILFEFLFTFLFWFKWFRIPLFIIGIGLHIGILIEFPIPFFALGVMAIYLLLVPNCFWRKYLFKKQGSGIKFLEKVFTKDRLKNFAFIGNDFNKTDYKKDPTSESYYQRLKFFFLVRGLFGLIILQGIASYSSPLFIYCRKEIGFHNTSIENFLSKGFYQTQKISKNLFGITNHGVFMDGHFKGYNHIVAINYQNKKGEQIWLPIIDSDGKPGKYNYGFNWVKWTWRVN